MSALTDRASATVTHEGRSLRYRSAISTVGSALSLSASLEDGKAPVAAGNSQRLIEGAHS